MSEFQLTVFETVLKECLPNNSSSNNNKMSKYNV